VDQLAAGLAQAAAESPDRLASMGAAAAEHVRSGFSLEAMLEKYDRLYTAAAGGNMMDLEIAADGTFCACQRKPDMR
jgi:glycosyltransferase involved in cell wall biosynthesis